LDPEMDAIIGEPDAAGLLTIAVGAKGQRR
jgi:hypothetical protein